MRAIVGLALVFTCAIGAGIAAQQQVRLTATILDAENQPPTSLTPADLRVMEDGEEMKVTNIEVIKRGVKVQILVDNGLGLGQDGLLHLRNGMNGLVKSIPEGIETTIVTTAPQPRFLVRASTDRDALLQGVGRVTPDSSPGRFVESLNEALQRVERDRGNFLHVIIMAATTAGERDTRTSDMQQIQKRALQGGSRLHVALLDAGVLSSSDGIAQREVGQLISAMTGGRFEPITAAGRLATLLPEFGARLAEEHVALGNQFRITVERPAGKRGELGRLTMRAGAYDVRSVSVD